MADLGARCSRCRIHCPVLKIGVPNSGTVLEGDIKKVRKRTIDVRIGIIEGQRDGDGKCCPVGHQVIRDPFSTRGVVCA
jgi:hypothetical protein